MKKKEKNTVKNKSKSNTKVYLILMIIILGLFFGANYGYSQFQPASSTNQNMTITIPKGSSTNAIANLLEENKLIKNPLAFKLYVKYTKLDAKLKAGKFELSPAMNLQEITNVLVEGNAIIDTVRFTIPEGYNVKQIAKKLADEGLVNETKFLDVLKDGDFDYDFIKQIPRNDNIEYFLEGYLFPETYEIKKGATEKEIIDKMLAQFDKEWKPEWIEAAKNKKLSFHELVTLASIVEREVVADKERPIVAGVFYNRLNDSWNLQSCATVQFVIGKQKDTLTFADLEIKNPYNTYINTGLPPGPIGNPGRKSLEAVIYPAEHDYYFFVTKKDNSGEHYFSKTFAEHQKYDAKSRGNW